VRWRNRDRVVGWDVELSLEEVEVRAEENLTSSLLPQCPEDLHKRMIETGEVPRGKSAHEGLVRSVAAH